MRTLTRNLLAATLCGSALIAAPAQAGLVVDIDFSEEALFTTDPTIEGVSFFAGEGASFADTITDDGANLGNPYLLAGADDLSTNYLPFYTETSFIGASLAAALGSATDDTTIGLDVSFLSALPSSETILMEALLSGLVQGSDALTTAAAVFDSLQILLDGAAFDALRIYVPADFGSAFIIDNLTVDVTPKTQPPDPPIATPAPATLLLLGLGLVWMRLAQLRLPRAAPPAAPAHRTCTRSRVLGKAVSRHQRAVPIAALLIAFAAGTGLLPGRIDAAQVDGRITVTASGAELLPDGQTTLPLKRAKVYLGVLELVGDQTIEAFFGLVGAGETDDDGNYSIFLFQDPPPDEPTEINEYALVVVLDSADGAVAVRDTDSDPDNIACLGTLGLEIPGRGTTRLDLELAVQTDNDSGYTARGQSFRPLEDELAKPVFGNLQPRCVEDFFDEEFDSAPYDQRGITNSKPERFAHLAVHYARAYDAYEFVRDGLGKGGFDRLEVHSWDSYPGMAYTCSDAKITMDRPQSEVLGSKRTSAVFDMRHEYGHHFMCISPIAGVDAMPPLAPGDTSHKGILNSDSADAWKEGFATWFAAAVAEYKGDDRPHAQTTAAGDINLRYGAQVDDPFTTGQQLTFGLLGEEFAVAGLLWDISELAGSRILIDALEKSFLDLLNFNMAYVTFKVDDSVGAFFDSLSCEFYDTATSSFDVDCLFIDRGFYHDKDGDGRFGPIDVAGTNEEVGRTRWPLGLRGPTDFRPHVPVLEGSVLRLPVTDAGGVPVSVPAFEVRIEYDPPLEGENSSYTRYVTGDGPYEIGILVPGVPSRALITPVTAGPDTPPPLVIESDFFHDRVNPFRDGGVSPILAEHTFVLGANLPPVAVTNGPWTAVPSIDPACDPSDPSAVNDAACYPITFDASGSSDPNSEPPLNDGIVTYEWDIDGDGVFNEPNGDDGWPQDPNWAVTKKLHRVPTSGTAMLRVTDSFGVQDTDSNEVVSIAFVVAQNYTACYSTRTSRFVQQQGIAVTFENIGGGQAENLVMTLADTPANVTAVKAVANLGTLGAGASATSACDGTFAGSEIVRDTNLRLAPAGDYAWRAEFTFDGQQYVIPNLPPIGP